MNIPVENLILKGEECKVYNKNSCPNKKCIAHIDTTNNEIQGNFFKIMKDFKFENYEKFNELKGTCLEYNGNGHGSFKKVYLNMKDVNGKKFITTDEFITKIDKKSTILLDVYTIGKEDKLSNILPNINNYINNRLKNISNEVETTIKVYNEYPGLVPRIYAVNLYIAKIDTDVDCEPIFEYRVQTLMDDMTQNDFKVIKENEKLIESLSTIKMEEYNEDRKKDILYDLLIKLTNTSQQSITHSTWYKNFNLNNIKKWYVDNEKFLTCLFKAMKKLHNIDVIHHDIKKDNIFYNEKEVKLIDFGMSSNLEKNKKSLENFIKEEKEKYKNLHEFDNEIIDLIYSAYTKNCEIIFYNEFINIHSGMYNLFLVNTLFSNLHPFLFCENCIVVSIFDEFLKSDSTKNEFGENSSNGSFFSPSIEGPHNNLKAEQEVYEFPKINKKSDIKLFKTEYKKFLDNYLFPIKDFLYQKYITV